MMGKLYVISAPSGAGKTTINRRLLEKRLDLSYSISYTTRTPRPGEQDGRDYFFVTPDQFSTMIQDGAFLEWAEVFDHYYGTGRAWVEKKLSEGRDILADVDIEGARQIKANFPEAVLLFIVPPSLAELRRRLMARHTETEEQLHERLNRASLEIKTSNRYDYLIINDDLELAVDDLVSIMRAEAMKMDQFDGFWPQFFSEKV